MIRRAHLSGLATLLALCSATAAASAQKQPCIPPFCFEGGVVIRPPPVHVPTPQIDLEAQARAAAEARARAEAEARARAEAALRAEWEAHFEWEARIRLEAEVRIRADLKARLAIEARGRPDPYHGVPSPVSGWSGPPSVRYPRVELGILAFCAGVWSGSGKPFHIGYCPSYRIRVNKRWGFALDPTVLLMKHERLQFNTLGLHPGAFVSLVHGKNEIVASHLFALAGLDAWFPANVQERMPDAFLGGHTGLGVHLADGNLQIGAEARLQMRGGVGDNPERPASNMNQFRIGGEVRFQLAMIGF
ncbi:hypothetical protein [Chondromyces crocatus]|uniref:Outer membrane protein beta-barrel domain-containing protein n=1 Tax=Chondromyces crocatus TaxID=52 RepID=A0A0K1EL35_CHOCO|nr:hypothetical protein [Chondromyces crocatus]AKT41546.1 uncharacterized protein CMC5_057530 [Chondromyces crocatus]